MTVFDLRPEAPLEPPKDESPLTGDVQYPCTICGKESGPYSGRGRPPTKCTDHKKGKSTTKRSLSSNDTRARQAAAALVQVHNLAAVGLMVARMPETASALSGASEGFEAAAYEALITDPTLCAAILKAGTTSGRIGLLVAYAMLAGVVVPIGWQEVQEKRAERITDNEGRPGDETAT